jgi:hypothetical protein
VVATADGVPFTDVSETAVIFHDAAVSSIGNKKVPIGVKTSGTGPCEYPIASSRLAVTDRRPFVKRHPSHPMIAIVDHNRPALGAEGHPDDVWVAAPAPKIQHFDSGVVVLMESIIQLVDHIHVTSSIHGQAQRGPERDGPLTKEGADCVEFLDPAAGIKDVYRVARPDGQPHDARELAGATA